jgi:hypothetical protein
MLATNLTVDIFFLPGNFRLYGEHVPSANTKSLLYSQYTGI